MGSLLKSKTTKIVLVGALVATLAIGALFELARGCFPSGSLFPEYKLLRQNVPLEQAQKECPIPLPANAKNISYGHWSCGIGFEDYLRFEAPPETCLAHIAVVLEACSPKEHIASQPSLPKPNKIASPPQPVRSSSREFDVGWFDIQNIRNGVTAGRGFSSDPQVWVDTNRGVFYYRITD